MLPGHSCTMDEFNNECRMVQRMTIGQLDLMNPATRKRFFDRSLKKYDTKQLLIALMEKGITLTDEQMEGLKNGQ